MSQLYDKSLEQYHNGDFTTDKLPKPPELPTNFHSDVMSPNVGSGELDTAIANYVLQWSARQDQPFNAVKTGFYTGLANDERFTEPTRNFLGSLEEHHGRAFAFYHGVRLGCSETNSMLFNWALQTYRPDNPATYRDELYEALTHRNAETKKPVPDDGAVTEAGVAAANCVSAHRGQREIIRPINDITGNGEGEYEAIYRTLIVDPGWSDYRRACLLLESTVAGEISCSYKQHDELFKVIKRNHDGETFRADEEAAPGAEAIERTKSVIQTINEWTKWNNTAMAVARDGLCGQNYDQLIPAFRHSDIKQLEMWVKVNGDFRAYELYRAAEHSFDDPRPVAFVMDHYEADPSQFNNALKRSVKGIVNSEIQTTEDALSTVRYLLEQGADPAAIEPSLTEYFLSKFYRNSGATPVLVEVGRAINEISGPVQQPQKLRQNYEVGELPAPLRTLGAAVYDPLIEQGILPSEEQFEALQSQAPEHAQNLLNRLPGRKQRYLQAATGKTDLISLN